MRRIIGIITAMFLLFMAGTSMASAEAPPSNISVNVNDTTGTIDTVRMNLLIEQIQSETDYELFVYVTKSFDGMSGAQWATLAAKNSHLDASSNVLYAIATQDRKFGSAYPKGTPVASSMSQIEDATMSSLKKGDWNGAIEAYGNAMVRATHTQNNAAPIIQQPQPRSEKVDNAFAGVLGVVGWVIGSVAGLGILVFGWIFGRRGLLFVLNRKRVLKDNIAVIQKTASNLPKSMTALDELIQDVSTKVSFASSAYGEHALVLANENMHTAKNLYQEILDLMDTLNPKVSKAEDVRRNLALATDAEVKLEKAQTLVVGAERITNDIADAVTKFDSDLAGLVDEETRITDYLAAIGAKIAPLSERFSAVFLKNLTDEFKDANDRLDVLKMRTNLAREVLKKTDFMDSKEALDTAKSALGMAKNLKALKSALDYVENFSSVRNEFVSETRSMMADNSSENAQPIVKNTILDVEKSLNDISAINCDLGNPEKQMLSYKGSINRYNQAVEEVQAIARNVANTRKNAKAIMEESLVKVTYTIKQVKKYGMGLNSSAQESLNVLRTTAQKDIANLSVAIDNVTKYDVETMDELHTKSVGLFNVLLNHISPIANAIHVEEERLRVIAAQKAEAERILRQQEEERRRRERKEREEREERERRNSTSSSSAFGAGFGSSFGGSSSSSSDFGSSGGSFGGGSDFGGSGGSF